MMQLPHTLDLNSLVKYNDQSDEETELSYFVWLNDKQSLSGSYCFLYGEYDQYQNRYALQTLCIEEQKFKKSSELQGTIEFALSENSDPDLINGYAIEQLYKNGARLNDFEKDSLFIPGSIMIYFNPNSAFDANRIEVKNYNNGKTKPSKDNFPSYAGFNRAGDLQIAGFYDDEGKLIKKLTFHENKNLCSIEQENDKAPIRSAEFDQDQRLITITPNKLSALDPRWGKNLQASVGTHLNFARTNATLLQRDYKAIYKFNQ
jgi:hypothetical protein